MMTVVRGAGGGLGISTMVFTTRLGLPSMVNGSGSAKEFMVFASILNPEIRVAGDNSCVS